MIKELTDDGISFGLIFVSIILSVACFNVYGMGDVFVCHGNLTDLCDYQGLSSGLLAGLAGCAVLITYIKQRNDLASRTKHYIIASVIDFKQFLMARIDELEKLPPESPVEHIQDIVRSTPREIPSILEDADKIMRLDSVYIYIVSFIRIRISTFLNVWSDSYIEDHWFKQNNDYILTEKEEFIQDSRDLCFSLNKCLSDLQKSSATITKIGPY